MNKLFYQISILSILAFTFACKSKTADTTTVTDPNQVAIADTNAVNYNVDTTTSKVMWVGSKPTGKHNGTVNVSNGTLSVQGGQVKAGSVTLNMNSINVLDLTGNDKLKLEAHLKGLDAKAKDDFFNSTQFPTAKFDITKVTGLTGDSTATHLVYGNLTLKGQTKEVNFKANITEKDGMINVTTKPFAINRTDWGIKYGSKTFFKDLKDKFIDDNMEISISLNAKK